MSECSVATRPSYYTSGGRKLVDFLVGFFGVTLVIVAVAGALAAVSPPGGILLGVIADILGIVFAFAGGRRFIAVGMLCAWLVPLLAFGACLVIVSQL